MRAPADRARGISDCHQLQSRSSREKAQSRFTRSGHLQDETRFLRHQSHLQSQLSQGDAAREGRYWRASTCRLFAFIFSIQLHLRCPLWTC